MASIFQLVYHFNNQIVIPNQFDNNLIINRGDLRQ